MSVTQIYSYLLEFLSAQHLFDNTCILPGKNKKMYEVSTKLFVIIISPFLLLTNTTTLKQIILNEA